MIKAVTFMLVQKGCVLVEWCERKQRLHHTPFFIPGGRVDPGDRKSAEAALRRGMREELGCEPVLYDRLTTVEAGTPEHPFKMATFLVTVWKGQVPGRVLDEPNNILTWMPILTARRSNNPAIRAMLETIPAHLVEVPRGRY